MPFNINNVKYFSEERLSEGQDITISGGKIKEIKTTENQSRDQDLILPGLIDLQIYGAGGRLFSAEPTAESLSIIEQDLLQKGTTGFLACIATNTPKVFHSCITTAKAYQSSAKNFLGLHLEGPFLNPNRLGAHVPEYVRKASLDETKALIDFGEGAIKMITIAPELQDENVIQYLLDHDVVVSLGHSDGTFEQATAAYNMGIQTTTHLFNAMSPLHHREPGIPAAVFNHKKAMASIIADGKHVNYEVVKIAYKLLKERLFLITDAVTVCNSGPYQHIETDNKFVMPDGTLSGSSLTLLQAIKNCVDFCDVPLADAIRMATTYPAKLIGLQNLTAKIAVNETANLLVTDQQLNLKKVIFNGEVVSN